MAEVIFTYKGINTFIQCNIDETMKEIIGKFEKKIDNKKNNLYYLYNGNKVTYELEFKEQANELDKKRLKMNIVVVENIEDIYMKNEIYNIKRYNMP